MTYAVEIPRIEDEIEQAWLSYWEQQETRNPDRDDFEAGFRAARTFILTGAQEIIHAQGAKT